MIAGTPPYSKIEGLTKFHSVKRGYPPFPTKYKGGTIALHHHLFSMSRTVFFSQIGEGYVIAYEVPDRMGNLNVGNHLGIQFLDRNLHAKGPLIERFGQIAGVANNAVYIFYPDGPEPIPGEPGALKRHYGLENVNDAETLIRFFKRIPNPVDGIHNTSLEVIVPWNEGDP